MSERGNMVRAAVKAGGGLVNQVQVSKIIDRNKSGTHHIVHKVDGFPRHVAELNAGVKLWLREEVEAWARTHPKQGALALEQLAKGQQ